MINKNKFKNLPEVERVTIVVLLIAFLALIFT